jgi:hypothetical protein
VAVTLKEWAGTPTATTIAGGSVTFAVKNDGTIPHEFVVLQTDTPAGDFPIESFEGESQRINEDTAGTNVGETGDLNAGATKSVTIDLAPGHYALVCNLPGHYGQGMHTDFTVIWPAEADARSLAIAGHRRAEAVSHLRLDVLVEVEQVARVELPLDLDKTIVVALVVGFDPVLVVTGHEVDIATLL